MLLSNMSRLLIISRPFAVLEDLFYIKSLHYEKKKGDLKGVDAVWINKQYRLFFYSSPNDEGIVVNALLFEISKHYE